MYKRYFTKFLEQTKGKLFFTAHSHHFWPDASFDAQRQYWLDSAKMVDDKWDYIFSEIIPKAQRNISEILNTDNPDYIAFAPNTHEFVARLLSCLDFTKTVNILTTDSEFHSFSRQVNRLEEFSDIKVKRISTQPFSNFIERFTNEIITEKYDLIFLSKVFFNSGFAISNIEHIINSLTNDTMFVLDGYHSFFAIPENLKSIQNRIFYLAGGYKYAMSGEGVCFLHIPQNNYYRPVYTGWFASFGKLSAMQSGNLEYGEGSWSFMGATFDPSGLYRFNAICQLLNEINLSIEKIHNYVVSLQEFFLTQIKKTTYHSTLINLKNLLTPVNDKNRPHFLTFRINDAIKLYSKLKESGIITDFRNDRLRVGFGIYHNEEDIAKLVNILNEIQ
jgi:selenocysteine lyase/cysteine desulfurase